METDLINKLNAIERVKAPDHLYTRLSVALQQNQQLSLSSGTLRFLTFASVMLVLMNIYVLSKQVTDTSDEHRASNIFGLNKTYQVYHD